MNDIKNFKTCELVAELKRRRGETTEYPKPMMKLPALEKMGFPREMLLNAYRTKGQDFAQKSNPGKKNSVIVFDTVKFEKWRMQQLKAENQALYR